MIRVWSIESDPAGQGRIAGAQPVAVLDIGSNSVRLVVYERHARALTVLYNEKSASTLGRGVAATGKLADVSMDRALRALRRFDLVCRLMDAGPIYAIATSAVREASNGPEFALAVEEIIGVPVRVLTGEEEAHFTALGLVAGLPDFEGIVGDLGGGSLELAAVTSGKDISGETFGLGVIRLQDDSEMSLTSARAIARTRLETSHILKGSKANTFGAIGGTWRALAKLHQTRHKYPLHMVQGYAVPATEILALCEELSGESKLNLDDVSGGRRDLLPYGAAVLAEVLRQGGFEEVVFSALGIREGYLYDLLDENSKAIDPLLQSTEEMSLLRSRAPDFAHDLIAGTHALFDLIGIGETPYEARLREAACYISDIGWRAHPDYRGEQSVDMVAFSDIVGIGHPDRAFLAQTLAYRYMGIKKKSASGKLLNLAGAKLTRRARLIGAYFRVAYPLAAAMSGILPRTHFTVSGKSLVLKLPSDLAFLDGEHLRGRMKHLATEAGFKSAKIETS